MKDQVQRAAFLSALLIGTAVLVVGILPEVLLRDTVTLIVVHAGGGLSAGVIGYFVILRLLRTRESARTSAAILESDLRSRERLLAENLQQRRLLETIFEADPNGIAVVAGIDLRYQLVNSAYRAFTLDPKSDPTGRPYAEVWREGDCVAPLETVRRVGETGGPVDQAAKECCYQHRRVSFFGLHLRRMEWEGGQAVLIVLQDETAAETARRRADQATVEAQRRADELAIVFEAMLEGVIVFDAEGTPVQANPPAAALLGPYLGKPDRTRMAQELRMRRPNGEPLSPEELPSGRALRGETAIRDRFVLCDPQGREITMQASASPLWVDGKIIGAVAVWHDVTDLERAEAQMRDALGAARRREAEVAALATQLATSEERWRSLVESANDAMVTLDTGGRILFWNPAAQAMFGHQHQEIAGQPFTSLLAADGAPDRQERAWKARLAEASALKGKSLEARGRRRNGEEFPLEYSYAPWETREGAFITATIRDTSESVQARARAQKLAVLEERQHLSRELHDSVSQALYSIALGAGTALALLDRDRAGMLNALEYVVSLTQLALAEMRAVIFELRPEAIEKEGLIAGLSRQTAALRARYQVAVREELCSEPDVPLDVKEALYRIAQEALHNSVKHAQASRIDARLADCGDYLELEISDNGAGFDPQQAFPGHLGLESMRERAVQQGGSFEIDSAPGHGTRVRAIVPANRPRA